MEEDAEASAGGEDEGEEVSAGVTKMNMEEVEGVHRRKTTAVRLLAIKAALPRALSSQARPSPWARPSLCSSAISPRERMTP